MDNLTITLVLCIGNAVAWLLALYTEAGMRSLLWNVLFGIVGAALCALAIAWLAPPLGGLWLLVVGPVCSLLAISAGKALRRVLRPAKPL
jgi:hypothetical protein